MSTDHPRKPRVSARERQSQAFVTAERKLHAHMDNFVKMCAESKLQDRILTFSELLDFKVKYLELSEKQCQTFMALHLVGCKVAGKR